MLNFSVDTPALPWLQPKGGVGFSILRLTMTAPAVAGQILALAEWEAYETSGGANFATTATATATSDGFGWTPDHINNGDKSGGEGWHALNTGLPQVLTLTFPAAHPLHSFRIYTRGGREDQAFGAALLEGWDGAAWVTLKNISGLDVAAWQAGGGSPSRILFTV